MTQPPGDEDLFAGALTMPAAERGRYIERACAGNIAALGRLTALLDSFDDAVNFVPERCVEQIGAYRLLRELGEGGCGIAYLAEQLAPVKRHVALKIIKPGMDTKSVIARFEAERQLLALMDHPNVAKVFDAGSTPTGRPYFVMELVRGLRITEYCEQLHLSIAERLQLFMQVCQAIQHAHQKGVMHRDIKPSNVLVTMHDGLPVAKVIDFGIAKALGQELTDKTLFTGFGQMVGTPLYMSPEQAGQSGLDVDTRSDIYSLGVLLYELLTGTTPFTRERFKKAAYDEIRRIIREEEPPRPSTRLSESKDALSSISAQRHMEPAKLTRLVRGELDWIVMKALEKDRNRRYETANSFALDVQRYLHDEPVEASPRSRVYRLSKFLRRNKGPVTAALLALLILIAGITGTTWGLLHADHNRRKAENALTAESRARQAESQARDQAMAALRAMTDEIVQNQMARGYELRDEDKEFLRKVLKHFVGLAAITSDDAESRAIRAEGYAQVGLIRHRLGELKEAEAALAEAELLWKGLVAESPEQVRFRRELAHSQNNLGTLFRAVGQLNKAEAAFTDAAANYSQLVAADPARPEFHQYLAQCSMNQGNLFSVMGRFPEAETSYQNALSGARQLVANFPDHPNYRRYLAQTLSNLGILLRVTGRVTEAKSSFAEALAIRRQLATEFPTRLESREELAASCINMGVLLRATSRWKEAESAYAESRAIYKQLAADFPAIPDLRHQLALSETNLARLYGNTHRHQEAEAAYAEALAIHKRLVADFPSRPTFRLELARTQNNLGSMLKDLGRHNEAEAAHASAVTISKQLVGEAPTPPEFRRELANSHNNLGVVFRVTGRLAEAQAAYADAVTIKKQLAEDFPTQPDLQQSLSGTLANLAIVCEQRRDFAGAEQYLREALVHNLAALNANPRNAEYRQLYRNNLRALAGVEAAQDDRTGALRAVQDIRALGWNSAIDGYHAARSLARCIPIANQQLGPALRQDATRFYADETMALLRDAVARGWKDTAQMKKDTDLDALRQRGDFQQLLADLERKSSSSE
jgi:serine/threonine protein kinase/tetratricopeptide (TPR) repeat protein